MDNKGNKITSFKSLSNMSNRFAAYHQLGLNKGDLNYMNYITLNNGVKIPQIGLGVFRTPDGADTANAVKWAIEAGYRHIDTAQAYGNERGVGEGVRNCGVSREKLFVVSKAKAYV